jgi:hypothetical protein
VGERLVLDGLRAAQEERPQGGTPVTPVISSRLNALSRSPGNRERNRYSVAPTRSEVVTWLIPASKFSGSAERMRSSLVFSMYVETIWAPTTTLRWLVATPLGIPVEPDVYRMVARSTSETCAVP